MTIVSVHYQQNVINDCVITMLAARRSHAAVEDAQSGQVLSGWSDGIQGGDVLNRIKLLERI